MIIGTSLPEWILIQVSIALLRYTPLLYITQLLVVFLCYGASSQGFLITKILCGLIISEFVFYVFLYQPYIKRLSQPAVHPPLPSPEERRALFNQCFRNVPSMEEYLRWWFMGADLDQIRRENVREWLLWAFFDRNDDASVTESIIQEVNGFIIRIEEELRQPILPGRGSAKAIRHTLEDIEIVYRGATWYGIVFLVDQVTSMWLIWNGFSLYKRDNAAVLKTFPPRPQELLAANESPAAGLSYWYRPHRSQSGVPIAFFHGIGIGLWAYVGFLAAIAKSPNNNSDIGVIATEVLPISSRFTAHPLSRSEFVRQMSQILNHHGWETFAIASHSYGSVLTTHMISSPTIRHRVQSVILIDPVTIMLHLPNVCFNFTRRRPRRANEWQLWYFASTEPGVAHTLGRYFFWRENIIWKEDMLSFETDGRIHDRKVAVFLAGRDLIIDTPAVAKYLGHAGEVGLRPGDVGNAQVEVTVFPALDHAQVFGRQECQRVVRLVRSYCG